MYVKKRIISICECLWYVKIQYTHLFVCQKHNISIYENGLFFNTIYRNPTPHVCMSRNTSYLYVEMHHNSTDLYYMFVCII